MGLFERALNAFRGGAGDAPAMKPGRNDACWCGSGKKYKKCHLPGDEEKAAAKSCSLSCGPT